MKSHTEWYSGTRWSTLAFQAAAHLASNTLWICRCAWTTRMRRPQLHRFHHSKQACDKGNRKFDPKPTSAEATGAGVVRQRVDGSGTFSGEAIRLPIQIVALHWTGWSGLAELGGAPQPDDILLRVLAVAKGSDCAVIDQLCKALAIVN